MSEKALFKAALSKAMAQCSRRELCVSDIHTKIGSWGISVADIDKIISVLIKENFINEERFAKAFVKDKFNYNKWGKVKIAAHLRIKHIPSEVIRPAIDSIETDVYFRVIKELISTHKRSIKAKNKYDLKAKLLRYGLSKGFESSMLYDILNEPDD